MKPTYEELELALADALSLIKRLELRIDQLEKRNQELEAKLNKNSKNSSKPPSTDQKSSLPHKKRKEKRPFHKGASRRLLPEDWTTSREVRRIENCPRCRSQMELTGEIRSW